MVFPVYGKKSFHSKESDTKILQSIYSAYDVGIISSSSKRKIANSTITTYERWHFAIPAVNLRVTLPSTHDLAPHYFQIVSVALPKRSTTACTQ